MSSQSKDGAQEFLGARTDATSIFDIVRLSQGTELLAAAVAHFDLFHILASQPMTFDELAGRLRLASRPAIVLIVALRAMGLIQEDAAGRLRLTPQAHEHLVLFQAEPATL